MNIINSLSGFIRLFARPFFHFLSSPFFSLSFSFAFTFYTSEYEIIKMNFALCYPTASRSKEESMPDGLYRPFFHGELVAEYRKSVASNGARKFSVHGTDAENRMAPVADYVEPGIRLSPFVALTQTRRKSQEEQTFKQRPRSLLR